MSELRLLDLVARSRITPDFLVGTVSVDVRDLVTPFDRKIDLEPLAGVIKAAMDHEEFKRNTPASDSWLAHRVHATLRLTRREAADRRMWAWLAVVAFPDYVRWRFPGEAEKGTALKRFFGMARDHALARLWWGAELTRNGPDYSPTAAAFRNQDVPNTWFALRAFEHKAAAIAACRVLASMTSDQINRLATGFDHVLSTVMLDSVATSPAPDPEAILEWIRGDYEEPEDDQLPEGPQEDPVAEDDIEAVENLLLDIATRLGVVKASTTSQDTAEAVEVAAG